MYGILLAALQAAAVFLVRQIVVKGVILFAIFAVVAELTTVLVGLLPTNDGGLASAFASLPSGAWYFLDLFQVTAGVPLVISAYVTRFIIRRFPVIG